MLLGYAFAERQVEATIIMPHAAIPAVLKVQSPERASTGAAGVGFHQESKREYRASEAGRSNHRAAARVCSAGSGAKENGWNHVRRLDRSRQPESRLDRL